MRYVSTRGQAASRDFESVLLAGLAEDGGLFVPETWPTLTPADWRALRGLPYPVLAARIDHLKRRGRNAFLEYQLPRTVINMKQGAGRLIRDETDRGVLMICDPRLISKSYGRRIWQSLPPMRRTRAIADVETFFQA